MTTVSDAGTMRKQMRCSKKNKMRNNRKWFCRSCNKYMRFARPSVDFVGYATTGRVYKCWKCGARVYEEDLDRGGETDHG